MTVSALDRGTRVTSPTAQPHLCTEPQGSLADFTYFGLRTATTAQPCQSCVGALSPTSLKQLKSGSGFKGVVYALEAWLTHSPGR